MMTGIDVYALIYIVGFAFVGLGLRFLALGRLEPIALELSFGSAAYSFGVLASQSLPVESEWGARAGLSFACFLTLAIIHKYLSNETEEHVKTYLEQKVDGVPNSKGKILDKSEGLILRSVLLTLVGFRPFLLLRKDKRTWRTDTINYINFVSGRHDQESELLLPAWKQVLGLVSFILLGLASVLFVIIKV